MSYTNQNYTITVTPDRLRAYITFKQNEDGKMPQREELLNSIRERGIVYGIQTDVIDMILRVPIYNQMICIAEGVSPQPGEDGRIEFLFDYRKNYKPLEMEDGRVDFHNLDIVKNVTAGQKLCRIVPPKPGTPGYDVYGSEIKPPKAKEARLPRGKNVYVSEDGEYLISAINGQAEYIDEKVNVFPTFEVPGDVDTSTGNISFVGNVVVRGNVLSGFSIEAGGNVEVWGVVEAAHIKAGGNITLRRGIQGMGKGTIISDGDIISKYIEHSIVEARNNITSEAIMHSIVKCGNKLELAGKKGLLVGGSCKVGKEITAKVIGSHMSTATDIEVGVDPSLRERYKHCKEEMNNIEIEIRKADQAITLLKKLEASVPLSPEKQELLAKSFKTKVHHTNRLNELKEEMATIEFKLQQETTGKIRCYGFLYSGTRVTIGTSQMFVKENLEYCTLYREGADIKIGPIDK